MKLFSLSLGLKYLYCWGVFLCVYGEPLMATGCHGGVGSRSPGGWVPLPGPARPQLSPWPPASLAVPWWGAKWWRKCPGELLGVSSVRSSLLWAGLEVPPICPQPQQPQRITLWGDPPPCCSYLESLHERMCKSKQWMVLKNKQNPPQNPPNQPKTAPRLSHCCCCWKHQVSTCKMAPIVGKKHKRDQKTPPGDYCVVV